MVIVDGRVSSWSCSVAADTVERADARRRRRRRRRESRRRAARKPTVAPAEMTCPSPLGTGVKTKREYCDVLTGRDPKEGILIKLPPHRGPVTLRFNLHNRHTYSEEEVRMKRGVRVVHRRHRRADARQHAADARGRRHRVPAGRRSCSSASAAAPVPAASKLSRRSASKRSRCELAAELNEVTILGEKLTVVRADGQPANYAASGRPIAIISDVTVEYTPAPAPAQTRNNGRLADWQNVVD